LPPINVFQGGGMMNGVIGLRVYGMALIGMLWGITLVWVPAPYVFLWAPVSGLLLGMLSVAVEGRIREAA